MNAEMSKRNSAGQPVRGGSVRVHGVPDIEQTGSDAKALISTTPEWKALQEHKKEIDETHLRDLIMDADRCEHLTAEYNGVYCDYSRQRVTDETMTKLYDLAEAADLKGKINSMFSGEAINTTEDRAVLHVATRAPRGKVINVDGKNVVPDVWETLDKINDFTEKVRNGEWLGATGRGRVVYTHPHAHTRTHHVRHTQLKLFMSRLSLVHCFCKATEVEKKKKRFRFLSFLFLKARLNPLFFKKSY